VRNRLRWNIDGVWLWIKRTLVKLVIFVFGAVAVIALGHVAFKVGSNYLNWLKTGAWETRATIAEAWPSATAYVASIEWVGVQRMGAWVLERPVLLLYVGIGVVCLMICIFLQQVQEDLEWEAETRRNASSDD
jgi:hypothetical protein